MGCSSSVHPSKVIKNFAEVSTQTNTIQMIDVSVSVTDSDVRQTDATDAKVNLLETSNISKQNLSPNVFLNSRLGANPRREKLEWNLFGMDAFNLSSIIQRELHAIGPTAIQIALNAMKEAVELQNLPQEIWNLLEKANEMNDPTYFILVYTYESDFYEILNRKLAQRDAQAVSSGEILDQFGSVMGNLLQNLNFALNSAQAMQTGQSIPMLGANETDWAVLYLRPLYRLLTVPNPDIRFQGETYRGMWISYSELQYYKDAEFVCHKAVTSTSAIRQVAQGFINRVEVSSPKMISVMFIYDINQISSLFALKIRQYSKFPEEEEVLILPGLFFRIVNINMISPQAVEIVLRMALDDMQSMLMNGMKSLLSLDDDDDYD